MTTPASRSRRSTWRWIAEILSLLVGVGCLVVIVVVLAQTDGKPPPRWPLDVTLNTFVAFLTSVAKVSFMLPIVEGLGQLKWMWFATGPPKPLVDFQLYDEASSGSWGCLKLLATRKGLLACLGALVALSGLLTSTVTQQVIEFQERKAPTANGTAQISRATVFSLYNGSDQVLRPYDTSREKQALMNGAFSPPNATVAPVTPVCSSGDCQWEVYGSLALCSELVNLTAAGNETLLASLRQKSVKRLDQLYNGTFNNGERLAYGNIVVPSSSKVFPLTVDAVSAPTGAFNESISALMASDNVIAYSDTLVTNVTLAQADYHFLELGFFWCTKSLSTSVSGGQPSTVERSTLARAKTASRYPLNFAWSPEFPICYLAGSCNKTMGGLEVELEPPRELGAIAERYIVDVWASTIGSALITESMYDALLLDRTRGFVASSGGGMAQAFAIALFGDFSRTKPILPADQMANMQGLARNIAQALTNLIQEGDTRLALRGSATAEVLGTVLAPQPFVNIHWPWLALLAAQLGLTGVFLAATAAATRASRLQIVKGSSLATLCGLDAVTRRHLGGIEDLEAVKARAVKVRGFLARGSDGEGLWLGVPDMESDEMNWGRRKQSPRWPTVRFARKFWRPSDEPSPG